jgi:hypothetical protein
LGPDDGDGEMRTSTFVDKLIIMESDGGQHECKKESGEAKEERIEGKTPLNIKLIHCNII